MAGGGLSGSLDTAQPLHPQNTASDLISAKKNMTCLSVVLQLPWTTLCGKRSWKGPIISARAPALGGVGLDAKQAVANMVTVEAVASSVSLTQTHPSCMGSRSEVKLENNPIMSDKAQSQTGTGHSG